MKFKQLLGYEIIGSDVCTFVTRGVHLQAKTFTLGSGELIPVSHIAAFSITMSQPKSLRVTD